jgi:hypothetical protein
VQASLQQVEESASDLHRPEVLGWNLAAEFLELRVDTLHHEQDLGERNTAADEFPDVCHDAIVKFQPIRVFLKANLFQSLPLGV